ncbi:MAG: hypothetical protein AVDCRST_MAG18-265, partial [uncultured Thermomicrobiales bacterium]
DRGCPFDRRHWPVVPLRWGEDRVADDGGV